MKIPHSYLFFVVYLCLRNSIFIYAMFLLFFDILLFNLKYKMERKLKLEYTYDYCQEEKNTAAIAVSLLVIYGTMNDCATQAFL